MEVNIEYTFMILEKEMSYAMDNVHGGVWNMEIPALKWIWIP